MLPSKRLEHLPCRRRASHLGIRRPSLDALDALDAIVQVLIGPHVQDHYFGLAVNRQCRRIAGLLEAFDKLRRVALELAERATDVETIAAGNRIRELPRLRRLYGKGRWRKMKGVASIRLRDGRIRLAELHWYEAHGIGEKEFKRKRYLD
jgi:hypothetical protein